MEDMESEKQREVQHSCTDCGTQNCKFQNRTYPDFCLTTHLQEEDAQWALERYGEDRNHEIMVASAEVEYEGYCQWTRVQEIMEFARKIGARKIGIANCIGLIREARMFARILRHFSRQRRFLLSSSMYLDCGRIGNAKDNPVKK